MVTILLIFFLFLSVVSDIRTYQVNNQIILVAIVCAISYRIIPLQWTSIYEGIKGFFLPFLLLLPLYIIGGIGAGDMKVFMILGMVIGWTSTFYIIFLSLLIGGVISIFYLIIHSKRWIGIRIVYEYCKECLGHIQRKQINSLLSYPSYCKIYYSNHCIPEKLRRNTIHFTIPIFIAFLYYKYFIK